MAGGMEAFPPLEINQENKVLTMLKEIFPSVEGIVVEMILEEAHGDFNNAADILISMCPSSSTQKVSTPQEDTKSRDANPFHQASSLLYPAERNDPEPNLVQAPSQSTDEEKANLNPEEPENSLNLNLENSMNKLSLSRSSSSFQSASSYNTSSFHSASSRSPSTSKHTPASEQSASSHTQPQSKQSSLPTPSSSLPQSTHCSSSTSASALSSKNLYVPRLISSTPNTMEEGLPELLRVFNQGRNIMLLLRGPPGSGKTTLAKKYLEQLKTGQIFSTDQYFMVKDRYVFKPHLLSEAHQFNQKQVRDALLRGERLIIVDNTNTMSWEMKPYLALASEHGYLAFLQEPNTPWLFNPKELARRNTHNVPKDKIEIMIGRYEKNITAQDLMKNWNMKQVSSQVKVEVEEKEDNDEDSDYIFNSSDEDLTDNEETVDKNNENYTPGDATFIDDINPSPDTTSHHAPLINPADIILSEEPHKTPRDNALKTDIAFLPETCSLNIDASLFSPSSCQAREVKREESVLERFWAATITEQDSWDTDTISSTDEPKPPRSSRSRQKKTRKEEIDITSSVYENVKPLYQPSQPEFSMPYEDGQRGASISSEFSGSESCSEGETTLSLSMDPLFAVQLQEAFGPPLDDSLLQFLNTEEILSAKIPQSLAYQFFLAWQTSLKDYLVSKPDKVEPEPSLDIHSEKHFPKNVLAPNAVEYYENKMLDKVLLESANLAQSLKKKPQFVLKSRSADRIDRRVEEEEEEESDLEIYRSKRNLLYKKAMDARSSKIMGASAFYSAEAREANKTLKARQREVQMEMFQSANEKNPRNKLDLHFLTTADAIQQLQEFIAAREGLTRPGGGEDGSIEIVTGKGNRSENGKSRLRPAVINWLDQKKYRYTEINSGAFKIYFKKG